MESQALSPLLWGGGALLLLAVVVLVLRARRASPDDRERQRRERLNLAGRITDGTVLGVNETPGKHPRQLLVFSYEVSGVTYEASQDVTLLRQLVDLHTCRIGLHASVKYDPQNPGNSIVVAESWSGLR